MSTARSSLRQSVARLMGEVVTGIPDTSLAANTFGCAALAVKVNAGQPNEEMTVRAVYHKCLHDVGGACEPEQEI